EIVYSLVNALWEDRGLWDVINLRPLDNTSVVYEALVRAFRTEGMPVQTYFCFGNWYLDVAGRSYEEYFESRPSILRKKVPYKYRKLQRTYRVRLEICTGEDGLEQALDDYEKIYNASWREGESHPEFIRGLVRTAAVNGWLRLGLLYLDDRAVAAQLWIVHAGIASMYKICYDEAFAQLSPGTLLMDHVMPHVIDVDKVHEVDFLSGDDAYKQNWMTHRRERWGILAFNPRRTKGLIQAVRHIGGRSLKHAYMNVTGRWVGPRGENGQAVSPNQAG